MASATAKAPKPTVGDAALDPSPIPASVTIARRGIRTLDGAIEFMSSLAGDLMGDDVRPAKGNAAMRAVENMASLFELKMKYGEGKDIVMVPERPADMATRLELLEAELKELRAAG